MSKRKPIVIDDYSNPRRRPTPADMPRGVEYVGSTPLRTVPLLWLLMPDGPGRRLGRITVT